MKFNNLINAESEQILMKKKLCQNVATKNLRKSQKVSRSNHNSIKSYSKMSSGWTIWSPQSK